MEVQATAHGSPIVLIVSSGTPYFICACPGRWEKDPRSVRVQLESDGTWRNND